MHYVFANIGKQKKKIPINSYRSTSVVWFSELTIGVSDLSTSFWLVSELDFEIYEKLAKLFIYLTIHLFWHLSKDNKAQIIFFCYSHCLNILKYFKLHENKSNTPICTMNQYTFSHCILHRNFKMNSIKLTLNIHIGSSNNV